MDYLSYDVISRVKVFERCFEGIVFLKQRVYN